MAEEGEEFKDDVPDPIIMNDDLVNYLQLLDYENQFCKDRGLKPMARCFFGVALNQHEQFMYFVALAQWLFERCGTKTSGWNQYDDPGTVTNNLVIDAKKAGVPINFPATKLKAGWGDAVCSVLLHLSMKALEAARFKFKKPVIPEDDEGDDGGEEGDMEGQADLAEMVDDNLSEPEDMAEIVEEDIPRDEQQ